MFILTTVHAAKRSYSFGVKISSVPYSTSDDIFYFRLCNSNGVCGPFDKAPNGWTSKGWHWETYVSRDIGTPYKAQIVHEGYDQLCVAQIYVAGTAYDYSQFLPLCLDAHGGCETITVILPGNEWSKRDTDPCEFGSILYNIWISRSCWNHFLSIYVIIAKFINLHN